MQKIQWGCTTPVMQPFPFHGDPPLALCPLQAFRDDPTLEGTSFGLHQHWTHGILPEPGGVPDQAANYELVVFCTASGIAAGQAMLNEIAHRKADLASRTKAKKK